MKAVTALVFALCLGAVACAPPQADNFVGSSRSSLELRSIQSRLIDGGPEDVSRTVVSTFHDLGYRIIRVDASSGTVSANRLGSLRMSAVVRAQSPQRSVVRVNAAILMPDGKVYEVDAPEFYQANFFVPLAQVAGREAFAVATTDSVPDSVRPIADQAPSTAPSTGTSR